MKKRYKLLLVLFISFILTIIIYLLFYKEKDIYLSISEKNTNIIYTAYINDYYKNYRNVTFNNLNNLYNKLLNNDENICYLIKNSKLITINLGYIELLNYKNIDNNTIFNYLNILENILKKIYNLNNNIYLIYYFDNDIIYQNIKSITNKYNIVLVDYKVIGNNIYKINNKIFIHYNGYKNIIDFILSK